MELLIEPELVMEPLTLNFHIEAIAVALQNNINELLNQNILNYPIFLSIPQPPHFPKFKRLTSAKFYFNALHKPGVKLILSQTLLNHKLPLADEMTLKAVELRCQEQMKGITYGQDFPAWIEKVLMNAYQMPTLAECANLLHVSTKTLQRQLRKKNTDFNRIKKEVMIVRAKQLLRCSSDSITQIAYELGYSSSSNFARAFKALAGLSPEAYRDQL
jgi:AraC-like DNA-binding protein